MSTALQCNPGRQLISLRFGVSLLLASSILLLITTISAPIWDHVGLLDVTLRAETGVQHESLRFGTFGYCVLNEPPKGSVSG